MKHIKNVSPNLVMKLVKQLNKLERDILCLYYLEDVSVNDIAILLREDKPYIRKILEEILAKLHHQISKTNSLSNKRSALPG